MKSFILTSDLTTQQLNQYWQRYLPFLKLQLYTPTGRLLDDFENQVPLASLSGREGRLKVDPDQSVHAFERAFGDTFGLRAEVLRNTGYTWDDTEYTRHWTLKQQNAKGKELSLAFPIES